MDIWTYGSWQGTQIHLSCMLDCSIISNGPLDITYSFFLRKKRSVIGMDVCVAKEVNFVLDLVNNFYLVRDNDSWKGVFYTSNFLCQFQLTVPSVFFSWFNGLQGFLKRERATTSSTECFTWKLSKVKGYGTEKLHFWPNDGKAQTCLNDRRLC